ncbi:porphobilinogen synthase [Pengzhenrongella frigida]|uniref:Delta-aminolevulinic acid dehydratase n=1 Tax=Pengzhenrongella frigida TaxID=1259133 RepID=A0A4Q5MZ62_9MICO|nr:porphobilinogen synthase [Cellulomonas sp. HLT2-17]
MSDLTDVTAPDAGALAEVETGGGPLAGLRVLVPRSADRAGPLLDALRRAGADPVAAPLVTIARPIDPAPMDDAAARLAAGGYDWVAVTSGFTVDSLEAAALRAGHTLADLLAAGRLANPGSTRVAAVGDATAAALARAQVPADFVPVALQSARGMLAEWPSTRLGATVLLPQSDLAEPTLSDGLAARGWEPVTVVSYTNRPAPSLPPELVADLAAGRVGAVVLTSGSVARRLVQQVALPATTLVCSIGPRTAEVAADLGLPVGVVADRPVPDAVVAALVAAVTPGQPTPPSGTGPATTLPAATLPTAALPTALAPSAPPPRTAPPPAPSPAPRSHPAPEPDPQVNPVIPDRRNRPRRLRTTAAVRRMVSETRLRPADLVLPLFIKEGLTAPHPIASMPGVVQHTRASLRTAVEQAADAGLAGVMLFGVPLVRDATGTGATDPHGILNLAIADAVAAADGRLVVMADLCLDEFTDHGHCGVLRPGPDGEVVVDNDATLDRYAEMAVVQARAGAHLVAPSGMMDHQIARVRDALDEAGFTDVLVLAYAAKYASAFYGPFRDAVESTLEGDRRTYQMDPGNRREAAREVAADVAEGADLVMVKPALPYLDVLADVAATSPVPVAAYQVSGEYAMIEAAAANGWIDRRRAIEESVLSIRRAGAELILTYWATELAGWLTEPTGSTR